MTPDRRVLWLALPLLFAGCERGTPSGDGPIDADNPLEMAARERGVVRPDTATPTGVFERAHDLGRDAMCAVPDGAGQWRFALTASYGPGLSCTASGTIVRDGDSWRMRFAGAEGCEAVVHEEEDELRMPGSLPSQCDSLCPSRASLSGLFLPRASWSEDDAKRLQMRDRRGNVVRPCGA
ncbi:hypothetical protein ATE67_05470 [Sphingopyxis sp. H050]|jgi:hypothetical protein|uniref:hypothetical protein n=1 Tax=Sphingopyxis sp. H050 TaxID=1759072 RepID=UPI0007373442|nr:hypothetical protein [Sphingopyxis sp. H050]KTE22076.1 hypothetical protein ATE67_05470 [Sphingopyxis sp. H050]